MRSNLVELTEPGTTTSVPTASVGEFWLVPGYASSSHRPSPFPHHHQRAVGFDEQEPFLCAIDDAHQADIHEHDRPEGRSLHV